MDTTLEQNTSHNGKSFLLLCRHHLKKEAKLNQLYEYCKTEIDLIPVGEDVGAQPLVLFNLVFLYEGYSSSAN